MLDITGLVIITPVRALASDLSLSSLCIHNGLSICGLLLNAMGKVIPFTKSSKDRHRCSGFREHTGKNCVDPWRAVQLQVRALSNRTSRSLRLKRGWSKALQQNWRICQKIRFKRRPILSSFPEKPFHLLEIKKNISDGRGLYQKPSISIIKSMHDSC